MKNNKKDKNKKKNLNPNDPRYMTPEQEQIVNLILSQNDMKTGKDVSTVFNELRGKVIQRLLDAEMDEFLGYNKSSHQDKSTENRRNGYTYVDCLYAPVKKDLISEKTAIYVMLGINKYGKKEVLGIWINQTESATFWTSVFEEIKDRGVKEILFVSMDGLTGLSEAIEKVFPQATTQRCIVHIVRNIYSILDKKKAKEIINDFKKIYTASNIDNAKLEYENFIEKYNSNTKLIKKVSSLIEHVFSIFEYPEEIRKIIYTTNPIESLNSCLRKVTRGKGSFISVEALLKVLYLRIKDLEKTWSKGTRNWNNVQSQIIELYGDRILKFYVEDNVSNIKN